MPKWIRDSGGRLVKCDTPQRKELEVILNIMEATPEDQHSHQGHQDNLNEFRSMRDRMHPPRMSAPSCIVPPTEQLVIRPYLVPLLPTFHGMETTPRDNVWRRFHEQKSRGSYGFLSYVAEVSRDGMNRLKEKWERGSLS
ncbi:hypothetical protein AAG906_030715 [Vitis piasezkii]